MVPVIWYNVVLCREAALTLIMWTLTLLRCCQDANQVPLLSLPVPFLVSVSRKLGARDSKPCFRRYSPAVREAWGLKYNGT